MAYTIKVDETEVNGTQTDLASLQQAVGGSIEIVRLKGSSKLRMIINKEGKLNKLPVNERATLMYIFGDHDPIVGDVVICNQSELE